MVFDCPNCAAALKFNPTLGKMQCTGCGSLFEMEQFDDKKEATAAAYEEQYETMECNIYSCTACGAEIAVNGVETSTFCSYCGQPAIVFSRVSSAKKPKYIIPFSITKEQAVDTIRQKLASGFFIPKEIQHFEIERVRGIYVPFWLYDIYYEDCQYLKGRVKRGKHTYTKYFYREANCHFGNLTLDGSIQLNDESSQRLEPYYMNGLKPFDMGYLSGFYADCYDMDTAAIKLLALKRTKQLFDKQVQNTVHASSVEIIAYKPTYQIQKIDYAMFPVWFMTFRYQNEPYTILVNGQTRKVIGAVPFHKGKVAACFWLTGIIASLLSTFVVWGMLMSGDEDIGEMIVTLLIIAGFMIATANATFSKVKKSIALSKSSATNRFVKNRQEEQ